MLLDPLVVGVDLAHEILRIDRDGLKVRVDLSGNLQVLLTLQEVLEVVFEVEWVTLGPDIAA